VRTAWADVTSRRIVAAVLLVLAPLALWIGFTTWLNLALPAFLNRRPERFTVRYRLAWMIVPGQLEVRGLEIHNRGRCDEWTLGLGRVSARIELGALWRRALVIDALDGEGAAFAYQRAEERERGSATWRVEVRSGVLRGLDEVRVGDFRYTGPAIAAGSATLGAPTVDADLTLAMDGGELWRGDQAMARAIVGSLAFRLDDLDRAVGLRRETVDLATAAAALDAQVQDLEFLDFYLQKAPWLHLDGTGHLVILAALEGGRLTDGTWFRADTRDLSVGFLGYGIHGDARVTGRVGDGDSGPQSRLSVQYGAFAIAEDGGPPLVTGTGFLIDAVSPDVRLDEPFTSFAVVIDLPESHVPDVALFDGYLPRGVGFSLLGGTGSVHGKLNAEVPAQVGHGDLWLDMDGVRGHFGDLSMTSDLGLHAHLEEGQLIERRYDFTGSRLDVRRLHLHDGDRLLVGDRPWTGRVDVRKGIARVGAPTWLDADFAMRCTDTLPFVVVFARKNPLPPWLRNLIAVRDVSGTASLAIGDELVRVEDLSIEGRQFEVLLGWRRHGRADRASLFARYGLLSLAVGIDGDSHEIRLLNARKWYGDRIAGEHEEK
jgi:hypothetical protein